MPQKANIKLFLLLSGFMGVVIIISNYLVQFPVNKFNLDEIANERLTWGVFRTRREDLYGSLSEPAPTSLLKKM